MASVNQTPGKLDFTIVKGDDFAWMVSINQNLTGYQLFAEILRNGQTYKTINIVNVNLDIGRIQLQLSAAETNNIAHGSYVWHFRWETPAGATRTILAGDFDVIRT